MGNALGIYLWPRILFVRWFLHSKCFLHQRFKQTVDINEMSIHLSVLNETHFFGEIYNIINAFL